MPELQAARGGIDWHQDGTEPGRAEERLDELRPILAHQRDAVALPDAGSLKTAGRPRRDSRRCTSAPI